jgi:hypothetical protein
MFVQSMTFEEIRKEFEKDKNALIRKVASHSNHVVRVMRKTNATTFTKYFDWISPNKNRWTYKFDVNYKIAKNHFYIQVYCLYFTERSYAVIIYSMATDQLTFFTSHFFTRYFEREHLPTQDLHQVIRTFMNNNSEMVTQGLKHLFEEKYDSFIQMKTGAGFGTLHQKINLVEVRTFITNDMLRGKQIELSRSLDERFQLGIHKKEGT